MTDKERMELEEAEEVSRRFLAWDLEATREEADRNVKEVLGKVIGRDVADDST